LLKVVLEVVSLVDVLVLALIANFSAVVFGDWDLVFVVSLLGLLLLGVLVLEWLFRKEEVIEKVTFDVVI